LTKELVKDNYGEGLDFDFLSYEAVDISMEVDFTAYFSILSSSYFLRGLKTSLNLFTVTFFMNEFFVS